MTLAALQTFLAVVETGALNKAAERLNVTQSTISARLDALEETLGQPLLVRSRRGAQLTRAGFAFRPHAELLVRGWAQARQAVGLPKGFLGRFSFACAFDLWASAGKPWLEAVRAAHPSLAYEAWPAGSAEIKAWLSTGLSDAALTLEPVAGPGLASREVARERLVQVDAQPRRAEPWRPDYLYVDLGSEFRRAHSRAWPADATPALTFAAAEWALAHLLRAGGSAYLPWGLVAAHLETGALHLVAEAPEFVRGLHLAWRETSAVSFPWIDGKDFWREINGLEVVG